MFQGPNVIGLRKVPKNGPTPFGWTRRRKGFRLNGAYHQGKKQLPGALKNPNEALVRRKKEVTNEERGGSIISPSGKVSGPQRGMIIRVRLLQKGGEEKISLPESRTAGTQSVGFFT